jgi:hypothetical protein
VGRWDIGEERSAHGAGDTRKDDGDIALCTEELELFCATTIQIWVSLLQSKDGLSLPEGSETHL